MAIAFDNAAASTSSSFSITIGSGASRIILIGIYTYAGSVSSVTVDGVSATAMPGGSITATGDGAALHSVFYLLSPNSGTVTIAITASGLQGAAAASYTGVNQVQPEAVGTDSSNTTSTATLTTITDNAWVVSLADGYNNSATPIASTGVNASRANDGNTCIVGDSNGVIHPAGSYSTTWTAGFAKVLQVSVAIAPAGGTPPADLIWPVSQPTAHHTRGLISV